MLAEPYPLSTTRGGSTFHIPLRLRVLVVDDNEDGADSMAELLRLFGADVEVRYSAEDVLDHPDDFRADACVLDLSMPGMDGCELAQTIRAMRGKQPLLVALTAWGDERTRRRTEESGFDLHFAKPVDPSVLLHALGEQMHRLDGPV